MTPVCAPAADRDSFLLHSRICKLGIKGKVERILFHAVTHLSWSGLFLTVTDIICLMDSTEGNVYS